MGERRHLAKSDLNREKFDSLVRFMVVAAERKRFVEYGELTKVFGISMEDLRDYADFLGQYCLAEGWPSLNALIINTTDGRPGEGFDKWANNAGCEEENWGEYVASCLKYFHLPMKQETRFKNTTKRTKSVTKFLDDTEGSKNLCQ